MGQVVDSSVLIAAERGRFDLLKYFRAHSQDEFFLSAITWSELLHGLERATQPAVREKRRRFLQDVDAHTGFLAFGRKEAQSHARIWASLESQGAIIGAHDLLIAATALANSHTLATLNVSEFARVPGLKLANVDGFKIS